MTKVLIGTWSVQRTRPNVSNNFDKLNSERASGFETIIIHLVSLSFCGNSTKWGLLFYFRVVGAASSPGLGFCCQATCLSRCIFNLEISCTVNPGFMLSKHSSAILNKWVNFGKTLRVDEGTSFIFCSQLGQARGT